MRLCRTELMLRINSRSCRRRKFGRAEISPHKIDGYAINLGGDIVYSANTVMTPGVITVLDLDPGRTKGDTKSPDASHRGDLMSPLFRPD